jgi:hypothetical protein
VRRAGLLERPYQLNVEPEDALQDAPGLGEVVVGLTPGVCVDLAMVVGGAEAEVGVLVVGAAM